MSWIYLVGIFCIIAVFVQTQDDAKFENNNPRFVKEGESLSLKCTLSAGAMFLVQKQLRIRHRSAKDGTESLVSEQGSLMPPFSDEPETYALEFKIDPTISAELTVKEVKNSLDGKFICEVYVVSEDRVQESVAIDVTVVAGIQTLEMAVEENLILDQSRSLKFREGSINVVCTATGSNPQPIIHLKIGDETITAQNTVIPDDTSDLERRSFKGEATYNLDFTPARFEKRLSCHAETEIPEGFSGTLPDKTVSVQLSGLVDKPIIVCHNKTAGPRDRQVRIKCLVSKPPEPKSVTFRLREPNSKSDKVVLYPGNKTESFTEVYKRSFNGSFNEYVLKFYQMENWHFEANIYFDVVTLDNKLHQEVVYLIKGYGSASSVTASITVSLLLALLTFLI